MKKNILLLVLSYMTTTDGYNYIIENWISEGTGE